MAIRSLQSGVPFALLLLALSSCTETPSPVGSSLLPSSEKVTVHNLDSRNNADSVSFSIRRSLIHFGTGGAANILFGLAPGVEARPVLKFAIAVDTAFIPLVLNTWTLHDCYFSIPITPYRYGDTSASVHVRFELREVVVPFESGATWDSLGAASSYGSQVLATIDTTVTPSDSLLRVPLDTAFTLRLLRYGWYDSLRIHFYGLVLIPMGGTDGVIGLYPGSGRIAGSITRDTVTRDTTLLRSVTHIYVSSVVDDVPADAVEARMGGAILSYLNVSLPRLPRLSAINAVTLDLTRDSVRSIYGKDFRRDTLGYSSRDSVILVLAAGDSSLGTVLAIGNRMAGTQTFSFPLIRDFIDLWRRGVSNHGVTIVQSRSGSSNPMSTFDRLVFHGPADADSALRPRLRVTYSTVGQ
jgi:hypothetical protein